MRPGIERAPDEFASETQKPREQTLGLIHRLNPTIR